MCYTATEINIRNQQYKADLIARGVRFNTYLNRSMSKTLLKMLTNFGPILGLIEQNIIVNKLEEVK